MNSCEHHSAQMQEPLSPGECATCLMEGSMANQLERWIQLVLGGVAGLKGCEFDPRPRQGLNS